MLHSPGQHSLQQVITADLAVAELLLLEGNHVGARLGVPGLWGLLSWSLVLLDEFDASQAGEHLLNTEEYLSIWPKCS